VRGIILMEGGGKIRNITGEVGGGMIPDSLMSSLGVVVELLWRNVV